MTQVSADRSVRSLLKFGIELLRDARVPSYTLAAELLLIHAAQQNRTWLYAHPEEILSSAVTDHFLELLRRRAYGEPTQHLTGHQEFWGLDFEVTPDVLIPRPETEHLIEVALDRLAVREIRAARPPRLDGHDLSIVDVGTGSGCIAIALAKELPSATIHATDISLPALEVARRNAARLGYSDNIQFLQSNLLDAFTASQPASPSARLFDLVISNPPYISLRESDQLAREVRDHEPVSALYGGEEGYELYRELILQASRLLKPSGLLVLELGYNSLPAVQPLLDSAHWINIGVNKDLAAIDRDLSAERLP